jgi:hypothetical protein
MPLIRSEGNWQVLPLGMVGIRDPLECMYCGEWVYWATSLKGERWLVDHLGRINCLAANQGAGSAANHDR